MINYLANPSRFLKFSKNFSPFVGSITLISLLVALYYALIKSPPAEEHGQSVRMMYTHVPAAWCALLAYTSLVISLNARAILLRIVMTTAASNLYSIK